MPSETCEVILQPVGNEEIWDTQLGIERLKIQLAAAVDCYIGPAN